MGWDTLVTIGFLEIGFFSVIAGMIFGCTVRTRITPAHASMTFGSRTSGIYCKVVMVIILQVAMVIMIP